MNIEYKCQNRPDLESRLRQSLYLHKRFVKELQITFTSINQIP